MTAAYVGLYVFLWLTATHRIERFLVPALAAAGALSGAGLFSLPWGALRRALSGVTALLGGLALFYLCAFYGTDLGPAMPLFGEYDGFLSKTHGAYDAWRETAKIVPPGAKVLLHGEAETFYIDFDFAGTTVFDRKILDEIAADRPTPREVGASLKEAGFSYVFANWATFRRQQETYGFEFDGVVRAGYSEVATAEFFEQLCRSGVLEPVYSRGGEVYPGAAECVLYRVK